MVTRKRDISQGEILAEAPNTSNELRHEWERNAPARVVAAKLIVYRADHDLSQRQLGDLLGVKQPQIARWETGEHRPSDDNLALIAGKLGIEFVLSFAPADRNPRQITKRAKDLAAQYAASGAVVRFAAE